MKRLLLCLLAPALYAQVTTVAVVDTMYDQFGVAYNGPLTISLSAPSISSSGKAVLSRPITVQVKAGAVSVSLVPNSNALPAGSSYVFAFGSGSTKACTFPAAGAPFNLSPTYCSETSPSAVAALFPYSWIAGCPSGQLLGTPIGGTATGCVTAAWGSITGTLANQTDLAAALAAAQAAAIAASNTKLASVLFSPTLLTGVTFTRVFGSNLPTGDNDIYTVPAGKRAFIGNLLAYASGAGAVIYFAELKVSSTYYRLATNSASLVAGASSSQTVGIALEAGDILSINTATTAGLNVQFAVMLSDNTASVKSVRLLGLSTGNNTLYTVPAGKSATILPGAQSAVPFVAGAGSVTAISDASSRNWGLYNVASGGTPSNTNQTGSASSIPANTRNSPAFPTSLGTGDSVVVSLDVGNAAQVSWVNVIEF